MADLPDDRLARAYRRLLLAYPRRYRRHRGAEMVTTLLDAAPPDRDRPPVRQAIGLVAGGVACRLRPPRGFGYRLLAVVLALVAGFFAAAAGSWLGWQTAPPLPTAAEAAALSRTAVPVKVTGAPVRYDFRFGFEGEPEAPGWFGGDDYTDGSVTFAYAAKPQRRIGPSDLGAAVHGRLLAGGWTIDRYHYEIPRDPVIPFLVDEQPDPATGYTYVVAHRGTVHLSFSHSGNDAVPGAALRLSRAEPPLVPALAVGGALAGALLGWLLAGWLGRRAQQQPILLAVVMFYLVAAAVLTLAPAMFYGLVPVVKGLIEDGHAGPPWFGLMFAFARPLAGAGVLLALAGCAIAALPVRARRPPAGYSVAG